MLRSNNILSCFFEVELLVFIMYIRWLKIDFDQKGVDIL